MLVRDVIPLLQTAISPVILISALGLLLLTMNNRLAHAIDRARGLAKAAESAEPAHKASLLRQVAIIWRRTRLLRHAIELVSLSALCAALLIIDLFLSALLGWEDGWCISLVFIASLAALIGSLVLLILDVHHSLAALQLELEGAEEGNGPAALS